MPMKISCLGASHDSYQCSDIAEETVCTFISIKKICIRLPIAEACYGFFNQPCLRMSSRTVRWALSPDTMWLPYRLALAALTYTTFHVKTLKLCRLNITACLDLFPQPEGQLFIP